MLVGGDRIRELGLRVWVLLLSSSHRSSFIADPIVDAEEFECGIMAGCVDSVHSNLEVVSCLAIGYLMKLVARIQAEWPPQLFQFDMVLCFWLVGLLSCWPCH